MEWQRRCPMALARRQKKKNAVTALPCVDGFSDNRRQNINKYDIVTRSVDARLHTIELSFNQIRVGTECEYTYAMQWAKRPARTKKSRHNRNEIGLKTTIGPINITLLTE